MRNGYFKIVSISEESFGVCFYPPEDGGEPVKVGEVVSYLDGQKFPYDLQVLKQFADSGKEIVYQIAKIACPSIEESYKLTISEDQMLATVRFYPPSEMGKRMSINEFLTDLRYKNIVYGIELQEIQDHFQSDGLYCTDLLVARGKAPRNGKNAEIVYLFNTDTHIKPTVNEDGSVNYFDLNMINHCHTGQELAYIIPEDEGEYGTNISGAKIKPCEVKKVSLKYGNNIDITEDKLKITSRVDGHVMLVEDKVFVSNVYEVENVGTSTGNIDFNGSVQINGNVASNFSVCATGNVTIGGVVEGAQIFAGNNIIIGRGMNGMNKGILKAGGSISAKFIESATVIAETGSVSAGSILHSDVTAGDEVIVEGKKGFLVGGSVRATNRICAKTLGAEMGARTVVEVGVDPTLRAEKTALQKQISEIALEINNAQPILANFVEKRAKGARFTPEQLSYIKDLAKTMDSKKRALIEKNNRLQELQEMLLSIQKAYVEVTGDVYPGCSITIGDSSITVQSPYKHCKFIREQGEVKVGS